MTEEEEQKIIRALSNNRWDYRTVEGIEGETKIAADVIRAFLGSRKDIVWKSLIPDRQGRDLYTLTARRPQNKEFWRNISIFGSKSSS